MKEVSNSTVNGPLNVKSGISGNGKFARSAITLALTAIMPIGLSHAQEVKELAVSQASAQTEDSYKVDKSTSDKYPSPY